MILVLMNLLILLFQIFCLLALLKKFAWGPITEALDNREATVRQNIADAEAALILFRVAEEQRKAEEE